MVINSRNSSQSEVDFVECDCCGLTEECTPAYIRSIRERYGGKWICGLCAEAVKDESVRCRERVISTDEAMARHLSFCNAVRAEPQDPTASLIRAMGRVLRRSLGSPTAAADACRGELGMRGRGGGLSRARSCLS